MSDKKPAPTKVTTVVVDTVASDIKRSNPRLTSEQARQIAIDSARRVDRESRERK